MKKLTKADLKAFRDRLYLPISDKALDADLPPYYHPGEKSDEIQYMRERRAALGGCAAQAGGARPSRCRCPATRSTRSCSAGSGKQQVATTMAIVRLFKDLMKDKEIGPRFVPIIPDEARTFGLDAIFPTAKIYSPHGQEYDAVDRELLLSYKESTTGQILHEGITEAGSMASLIAAATRTPPTAMPMIPFYIFYSMFGFQRTGDQFWAARRPARPRVRARRDGRAHDAHRRGPAARRRPLAAARLDQPGLRGLRPRVRVRDRAHRAGRARPDVRRRRVHRARPSTTSSTTSPSTTSRSCSRPSRTISTSTGCCAGMYRYSPALGGDGRPRAQMLASGVAVPWALDAQRLLGEEWGVDADVWSVTSWNELRRDAVECEEPHFLDPDDDAAGAVRDPRAGRGAGPGRRGVGLHARRARPDRAMGAGRLHLARRGRVRLRRHPRRRAAVLPHRRRSRSSSRCSSSWPGAARSSPRRPRGVAAVPAR